MIIPVSKTMTYEVAGVRVERLQCGRDAGGGLSVMVPYSWLDADGAVLRSGNIRHGRAELEAMFAAAGSDFSPFAGVLEAMIPAEGSSPVATIRAAPDGVLTAKTGSSVEGAWKAREYSAEELEATLVEAGLSSEAVRAMLAALAEMEFQ